jgi:hypothetical protein
METKLMSKKMNLKNWIPVAILSFAFILAIASLNAPWWTVKNPISNQIQTNVTNSADYNPSQTISANHVENEPNNTVSIVVPFADLAINQTDPVELNGIFNAAYYLVVSALIFIAIAIAVALFSIFRKPIFSLFWIFPLAATLLLFVAPVYLAAQMPPVLTNLATVMPPQIGIASGSDVTGFWGSSPDWTWGAGTGWTMMLTAAFLSGAAMVLVRAVWKTVPKRTLP